MNKGFLFNVKHLCLNPQDIINDFIRGKRKNIFNPISFLIITVTVYLIIDAVIIVKVKVSSVDSKVYAAGYEAGKFVKLYFKYFWILSIIWLSVSTKLVFQKYNYAEHLAINSFVMGQATLIGLISFIITKEGLLFNPLVYISVVWLTYAVFKRKKRDVGTFLRSLGATALFFIQLLIIVVLIGIIRSY